MPELIEQVGGFLILWPDINIEGKISRLHVHSDGHVTGMLAITHKNGQGNMRLLPNTQFNFSSEQTRARLAKQLAEKYNQIECSWVELTDYLGETIQQAALNTSPATEVMADEDAQAPPLLIPPFIYQGHQNIIFGEKGVAKSTMAYLFGVCLARPEWANPLNLEVNTDGYVTSLVLDWETDLPTFQWYLGRLRKGNHFGAVPMHYRRCYLPLAQDIEAIADEITRTGAKHLIIDSLGAAAGTSNLKDADTALDFNAALRKLPGMTATIIAQTQKSVEVGNRKTIYGSHFFTYYARNIFELYRGRAEGETQYIAFRHTDCNFAPKHAPLAFKITYDGAASIAVERTIYDTKDFIESVSASQRLLAILRSGPLLRKEIIDVLGEYGVSEATVDVTLGRLKKAEQVRQLADKRWGLAAQEEDLTRV